MLTIAQKMGYLEEEGLTIEMVSATANADAMALVATGKTDIVSNSGTSNPLQQIASGVDLTIFGGHMVDGCMPVIALKGTEWNGVQDFIGKKVAINPAYYAFTGAVMDLGYEDPLSVVEWVVYSNYNDALAAVVKGEVSYALQGTGQMYPVTNMDEVEIVTYQGKVMPNYSCCRLVTQTDFINNNPNTVKALMRALIRAQQYYEANKEEAVAIHAENIGTTEEYVAAFMLNENYVVSPDPLKNSVIRAWGILDKTGFLNEKAKNIDILDHINIDLYKAALDEMTEEHGSEDPAFYERLLKFYNENNF
jgi:NitT/TauT family transport system substrate-binding protein